MTTQIEALAAADAAHRAAFAVFQAAVDDYRAKRIDDAEFIAAADAHKAALAAWEKAEAAAIAAGAFDEPDQVIADGQIALDI